MAVELGLKRRVLERFVTSATSPIYAVRSSVPDEVWGAFASYFSRNPRDFRENIWSAITGTLEAESEQREISKEQLEQIIANPSVQLDSLLTSGLTRAQEFFRKWYGKYGHKSIANVVPVRMVATNVSQLFARELAYQPLAFFIEQSTRFVKFDTQRMYFDEDVMQSRHADSYKEAITRLTQTYDKVTELMLEHNKRELPFDKWLELQSESVRESPERLQRAKYNREMRGKTLDATRYLLPQATLTNIAFIIDARSLESAIARWKGHPLREMVQAAEMIEKHAGEVVPSLLRYTEKNEFYSQLSHAREGSGLEMAAQEIGKLEDPRSPTGARKGVEIISYDPDTLNKLLASFFLSNSNSRSFKEAYEHASSLPYERKIDLLRELSQRRGRFDEFLSLRAEFETTPIVFAIQTDLGAVRDWRRHQIWARNEPLPGLARGYFVPQDIERVGGKALEEYKSAMDRTAELWEEIARDFPYQAAYVVPMAAAHEIVFSGRGLDQLQYLLETRSTPQGNPSYRQDAFNVAEAFVRKFPWMLGYSSYPEGKPFEEVYAQAPLKNLLRLKLQETALHE
ncbi:hypothetical protein D6817_00510 [Candidatus Pacearchaeota archaeon]|nr:MAG: hypothetical protein D6817_00510 [Candidatus Pacearchaeota archaeon]